jgi:hypothetical protein
MSTLAPIWLAARGGRVRPRQLRAVPLAALCRGRKPPLSAVKRPARPYKRAILNGFTVENAEGA